MKGGILEVLVVGAEDLGHTNFIGHPSYFTVVQCGSQIRRTKLSSGKHGEVCWNEKFSFKFSLSDWKKLTHLHLTIFDKKLFSEFGFVGKTKVHLAGIVTEGIDRGSIELMPAFYNVVLEDDTYKGQIKIGFKFTVKNKMPTERKHIIKEDEQPRRSICTTLRNMWKSSRLRMLCYDMEKRI